MRWRFAETEAERVERARVEDRMRQFWAAWQKREPEIRRGLAAGEALTDLAAWMEGALAAVGPGLAFEYAWTEGTGLRLVITPETTLQLMPMARTLIELAPVIEGWTFQPVRGPEPFEQAQLLVQGRTGGDVRGWHVIVSRVGRRVRLRFLAPDCRRSQNEEHLVRAQLAAWVLLGERIANAWLESVLVDPLPARKAFLFFGKTVQVGTEGSVPVEQLAERVGQIVASMLDELPPVPLHEHLQESAVAGAPIGSVYKLGHAPEEMQRREAAGYPGQSDLLVAGHTVNPLLPAVSQPGFSSMTLSRVGEHFCYLKLDGTEDWGTTYQDRGQLEDALTAALAAEKLGCTLGGGTGARYSYVELALTDVERGFGLIADLLRAAAFPRRSWLHFHDDELAGEWLGLYPESPPPPQSGTDWFSTTKAEL